MPYAFSPETAREWATERAVEVFALFAGDLTAADLQMLQMQSMAARHDGAKVIVVVPEGTQPVPGESVIADLFVEAKPAPSPIGLFVALEAAQVEDVRKLAVLGSSMEALAAGRRAGAGAVIGIAIHPLHRRELVDAQPDAIIPSNEFLELDKTRFSSVRKHRQRVLLSPEAAVTTDRVHRAAGGPDLCHAEPEFAELLQGIERKLVSVADAGSDWAVRGLPSSAAAAIEAMTGACVRPGRKLLVCKNGGDGERIGSIARRLGIDIAVVEASNLDPIDPAAVAVALDADPAIDAVAVVHHDTATGMLNPVHEIAAEATTRGVLVAVDATSSFGAEELRLADTGIDFVASTSDRCLHGLAGAAFVLVSSRGQERIRHAPSRSSCVDITGTNQAQTRPNVPALYSLDAALDELIDETPDYRRASYTARIRYLDEQFSRLGLEPHVAKAHRSRSVRVVPLPDTISYDALHGALKAHGYVIDAGPGDSPTGSFRVAAFGAIKIEALAGFVSILERVLARAAAGTA